MRRCCRCAARVEQAFDVFREDVDFDVDGVVGDHCVDIGVRVGEGDDGDVGDAFVAVPASDGKADAVDGDGAFFRDIAAQILREANGEPPIFAFRDEARDTADSVDVTLYEMPADAGCCGERTFEIYVLASFFFAEGGSTQRFAGKIGGAGMRVAFYDGEAAAVDGDAVAELHF